MYTGSKANTLYKTVLTAGVLGICATALADSNGNQKYAANSPSTTVQAPHVETINALHAEQQAELKNAIDLAYLNSLELIYISGTQN